jgi:hypothetical protein
MKRLKICFLFIDAWLKALHIIVKKRQAQKKKKKKPSKKYPFFSYDFEDSLLKLELNHSYSLFCSSSQIGEVIKN